jgi:hypothetical protein
MWVLAYKVTPSGTIERFKGRLIAKGFAQKPGVDFKETWAPTGSLTELFCLFAYAAACDFDIIQTDIRKAFLNGPLDKGIYLAQPPGFNDGTNRVWRLHKALYGLHQGAHAWYLHLRDFLRSIGYCPTQADCASFVKVGPNFRTFLFTHVDGILLFAPHVNRGDMGKILQRFEGKMLGEVKFFLRMNIARERAARTISVDQSGLIRGLVRRSGCDAVAEAAVPCPQAERYPQGRTIHRYLMNSLPCTQQWWDHCFIPPP